MKAFWLNASGVFFGLILVVSAFGEIEHLALGACSHSACAVTCGPGVFPLCGTGTCNKARGCAQQCNNGCKFLTNLGICECNGSI